MVIYHYIVSFRLSDSPYYFGWHTPQRFSSSQVAASTTLPDDNPFNIYRCSGGFPFKPYQSGCHVADLFSPSPRPTSSY